MAPRRQAQAITPPPAGAHTGAQVLAFVGTNPTDRPKAIGSKWRPSVSASGRCAFRTFRFMENATEISTKTLMPVFGVSGRVSHISPHGEGISRL